MEVFLEGSKFVLQSDAQMLASKNFRAIVC